MRLEGQRHLLVGLEERLNGRADGSHAASLQEANALEGCSQEGALLELPLVQAFVRRHQASLRQPGIHFWTDVAACRPFLRDIICTPVPTNIA